MPKYKVPLEDAQAFRYPSRLTSNAAVSPREFIEGLKDSGQRILAFRRAELELKHLRAQEEEINPIGRYPEVLELLQKNTEYQRKLNVLRRNLQPAPSPVEVTPITPATPPVTPSATPPVTPGAANA